MRCILCDLREQVLKLAQRVLHGSEDRMQVAWAEMAAYIYILCSDNVASRSDVVAYHAATLVASWSDIVAGAASSDMVAYRMPVSQSVRLADAEPTHH